MLRAALKGVLARKVRLLLSLVAVALSVAFVAGTFIFTASLQKVFDDISAGTVADVNITEALDQANSDSQTGRVPGIDAALVTKVAGVEGVERADGTLFMPGAFLVGTNGKLVGGMGAPSFGGNWSDAPAQNHRETGRITEGRAPQALGEVAIDPVTLKKGGYKVGDTAKVITAASDKPQDFKVVGTFDISSGGYAGASVLFFSTEQAQKIFTEGKNTFSGISVTAARGQDQEAVAKRVRAALPADAKLDVKTGKAAADEMSSTVRDQLAPMTTMLLVFAAIALVVGAFLILNTFSMIVAQRAKEMALFRAMGASRRQTMLSVLLEALITGIIGSTLGILLGFALAALLAALISQLGLDMDPGKLAITPTPVIAGYVVGTLVTLVAALYPAWRAGRVSPVRAMANVVEDERKTFGVASIVGAVLSLLGLGLVIWAATVTGARLGPVNRPSVLGLGMLALVVGCAILAPVVGRPIIAGVGWLYRRLFGTVGKMAETNSLRSPGRTAATATALMIGVTLVVGVGMLASSFKASMNSAIDDAMPSDFMIASQTGSTPFSPGIAEAAKKIDGVEYVAPMGGTPATVDGDARSWVVVMPGDTAFRVFDRKVVSGDAGAFAGPAAIALEEKDAQERGKKVGDSMDVSIAGKSVPVKVTTIYSQIEGMGNAPMVTPEVLAKAGVPDRHVQVFVHPRNGADLDAIRTSLEKQLADNPIVSVSDKNDFKKMMGQQMDLMQGIIFGLLGLAIIISILGIINTLGLSVVERTREIGLLRAIGMSRGQMGLMIPLESILICLLGAVMGLGLGLLAGFSLLNIMKDQGLTDIVVPWGIIITMMIASVVVGILAALWPAWKASRQNVLAAIATE